jgi:hypothetical protein
MSNLTTKTTSLPTVVGLSSLAADAISGVSTEARMFPEISIKGARWRLRMLDGEEHVLNSFNIQFALIAANPAKSKTFYLNKYDPDGEPRAPDCASDNGIRPNDGVEHPQSPSCANCPHNVWGSDINPVSGKKNKRCKDSKRIAVMLVGDPGAQIFAWRLSPMNMLSFSDAVKDAVRQNIDLERVAFDAAFDAKSDYPRVVFTIKRPLTEEELHAASQLRQSEGAKAAVGMGAPMFVAPVRVVVAEAVTEAVTDGARNDYLSRACYAKIKNGVEGDALVTEMLALNESKCVPPLPESEVLAIVHSKEQRDNAPAPEKVTPLPRPEAKAVKAETLDLDALLGD